MWEPAALESAPRLPESAVASVAASAPHTQNGPRRRAGRASKRSKRTSQPRPGTCQEGRWCTSHPRPSPTEISLQGRRCTHACWDRCWRRWRTSPRCRASAQSPRPAWEGKRAHRWGMRRKPVHQAQPGAAQPGTANTIPLTTRSALQSTARSPVQPRCCAARASTSYTIAPRRHLGTCQRGTAGTFAGSARPRCGSSRAGSYYSRSRRCRPQQRSESASRRTSGQPVPAGRGRSAHTPPAMKPKSAPVSTACSCP